MEFHSFPQKIVNWNVMNPVQHSNSQFCVELESNSIIWKIIWNSILCIFELELPSVDEDGVTEGPEAEPESSGLWVVERVIGALLSHEEEKVRMWFLIKWDGWPQEENSWEPVAKKTRKKVQPADLAKCDGVNAQSPAVKDFYKTYGYERVMCPL
jgi:hypothetical protein